MLTAQPCPRQIHPKSSLPYENTRLNHREGMKLHVFVRRDFWGSVLAPWLRHPALPPWPVLPLPWPAASASIGGISVGSDYQLVCAVNVTLGGDYDVDGAQLRQRHHLLKVPLPLLLTEQTLRDHQLIDALHAQRQGRQ